MEEFMPTPRMDLIVLGLFMLLALAITIFVIGHAFFKEVT